MKLIIGLGNPGNEYKNTRHNIGFMVVDSFADKHNVVFKTENKFKSDVAIFNYKGEKVILVKPLTYMNLSGEAVRPILDFYKIKIDDMIIICDDLDSNPGRIRLRQNGSSGGHNGLKSIIQHINTEQFKRIKIGIGRDKLIDVASYVLGNIKDSDKEVTEKAIDDACLALEDFINGLDYLKISSKYSKK